MILLTDKGIPILIDILEHGNVILLVGRLILRIIHFLGELIGLIDNGGDDDCEDDEYGGIDEDESHP